MWIPGRSSQIATQRSKLVVLAVGLLLLATVGTLDWVTGPNLDFSLFYLLPVGFVTWHAGSRLGYVTSAASAAVWLYVDRLTGAKPSVPLLVFWNLGMRLAFFSGSVLLLEGWKRAGEKLSAKVEERTAALRRLGAQLSAAEEAERRRLALDMHDAVSQTLSLIKINLDAAQIEVVGQPGLQDRLADCGQMVDAIAQQTRSLMFDLYPAMLDDLGLLPTLEWYGRQLEQRVGLEVVVSEQGTRRSLPKSLTNLIFRATKELLGNAVQHGRAKEIIVVAHWESDGFRLVVDDDGVGFDVNALKQSAAGRGLGLPGITERLGSMGGRLSLESTAGQGTRAILEVPLMPDALKLDQFHAVTNTPS